MSEYRCESCAIYCECKIPNECDFVPEVCLAQLDKQHYEPKWEKIDEPTLDTKQEKIGSGHTGACQEGCQCDVAKMGKQEKCPEYSEVEKNIIKWWREGNITLHYNSNYKGAIIGTGTMGEGGGKREKEV